MKLKYKVGDFVKIINWKERPDSWNEMGYMDYLQGTVVRIAKVNEHFLNPYAILPKDSQHSGLDGYWHIKDSDIISSYNEELE